MLSSGHSTGDGIDLVCRPCSATFPPASITGWVPVMACGCGSVG